MNIGGYGQALIHLAWYRNDKTCYLLFGMVELRPNELPPALGCSTKNHRQGKGRKYVHYVRISISVDRAIDWYKAAVDGSLVFPEDRKYPASGTKGALHGGPFVQDPCWPEFVTSNNLVFAPDWMHGSRAHFLFPKSVLSPEIIEFITHEKIRTKLREWLNFDIASVYSDYQGSVCLIAPNPLYRSIKKSHLEQPKDGFAESVAFKVVSRSGQKPDGLRLVLINERLRGRTTPMVHEFDERAIVKFDLREEIYKEGMTISHPEHGLLEWHEPLPLIRKIHTEMALRSRKKSVRVPSAGRRWPDYEYSVDEFVEAGSFVTGDPMHEQEVISRLSEADCRRTRHKAGKDYDQEWFYRVPADAAEYIRNKIGKARRKIIIVDPYFTHIGLLAFGHATRWPSVDFRILTSAENLKQSTEDDRVEDNGSILERTLDEAFRDVPVKPEIRVLLGKSSPIHDRFLVIDDEVWLSGNSLATLGERAGIIVRLPEPESVILRLGSFWNSSPDLSEWRASRSEASDE